MRLENGKRRCHLSGQHIALAAAALVFSASCISVFAQANANSTTSNTEQAAVSPTPEPTAIPITSIISQSEAVEARLRAIRTTLADRPEVLQVEEQLAEAELQIDTAEAEAARILSGRPSLEEIRAVESEWQAITRRLASLKRTLSERAAVLDSALEELNRLSQPWRLTLSAMQDETTTVGQAAPDESASDVPVPNEILQKVYETITAINETRRQAQERRTELLTIQQRLSELESRAAAVRDEIRLLRDRTLTNLFIREEPPIWAVQSEMGSVGNLLKQAADSFASQMIELRAYVSTRAERFGLHAGVFILVTAGLYWARRRIRPFVVDEPRLAKAAQIFALPVATGLILTIVFSSWFYPQAPRLLNSLVGAAALVPVVLLLRRMVEKPLFTILNALVALYFVDRLRDILVNQPLTARFVFLAEMLGAMLFLTWFLKSKKLSGGVEAAHYRLFESIRKVVPFVLAVFAFAFAANALGFVSFAYVIGNGVLGSAYLALVIYTAVQIIRGLIIFALRIRPLAGTLIVKNNRALIRERSVKMVRWAGIILWVFISLNLFSIRSTIYTFLRDLFSWSATIGTVTFSIGSVVLFFLMIWGAVLISRFLRFVLEEDVYPRADLGGGVSYAVSTMLHYSVLVIGFMVAVGVLGVDFTKFALIAGAVGIGIGFGLQNIINNFVSGLILLVERPVKIDDTVQIGEHTGSLKRIGLRASVLRKVDGSDVIVPNSQLISEEVINWTMSDEKRRIDIPVGVAYGTDPKVVMDLLSPIAGKYSELLHDPEPRTLFLGLGESSLDFELRVWTSHTDGWVVLRSEIMTDVYDVLTKAGIEIPFPQRDLNIRNIEAAALEQFREMEVEGPDQQP